jgi:hypothetical protein
MPDLMERLADSLSEMPSICPESGVHRGIDMEMYQRWDALSCSRMTALLRSPAHLRAYLDGEQKDTAALIMGRAIHSAVLEPDDFAKRYGRSSGADRRTKAGKQEWDDLLSQFGDGYVLSAKDYDTAMKIRASVYANRAAAQLLNGDGDIECSVVWDGRYDDDDASLVVRSKARLDRYTPIIAGGAIIDIKTTKDASRREFERSIYAYGYHRKAFVYLEAAHAAGLDAQHFVIIAQEKEAPYAQALYRLTEGAIEAGKEQVYALRRTYAMCEALNEWPSYPQEVQDVALPAYAWGQIDDDLKETAA